LLYLSVETTPFCSLYPNTERCARFDSLIDNVSLFILQEKTCTQSDLENIHFHMLFLDGVYAEDNYGKDNYGKTHFHQKKGWQ